MKSGCGCVTGFWIHWPQSMRGKPILYLVAHGSDSHWWLIIWAKSQLLIPVSWFWTYPPSTFLLTSPNYPTKNVTNYLPVDQDRLKQKTSKTTPQGTSTTRNPTVLLKMSFLSPGLGYVRFLEDSHVFFPSKIPRWTNQRRDQSGSWPRFGWRCRQKRGGFSVYIRWPSWKAENLETVKSRKMQIPLVEMPVTVRGEKIWCWSNRIHEVNSTGEETYRMMSISLSKVGIFPIEIDVFWDPQIHL